MGNKSLIQISRDRKAEGRQQGRTGAQATLDKRFKTFDAYNINSAPYSLKIRVSQTVRELYL